MFDVLQAARGVAVSTICIPCDLFGVLAELGKALFRACGAGCSGERREEVLDRAGQLLRLLLDVLLVPLYALRAVALLLFAFLQVGVAACTSLCSSTGEVWDEVDDLPSTFRESLQHCWRLPIYTVCCTVGCFRACAGACTFCLSCFNLGSSSTSGRQENQERKQENAQQGGGSKGRGGGGGGGGK